MYIAVRRDLNLPAGKLAVQVAHAASRLLITTYKINDGLFRDYMSQDVDGGSEAKIVLGVDNLDALYSVQNKCAKLNIPSVLVQDAGRTVLPEPTYTCLAFGPVYRDIAKKFRYLTLY